MHPFNPPRVFFTYTSISSAFSLLIQGGSSCHLYFVWFHHRKLCPLCAFSVVCYDALLRLIFYQTVVVVVLLAMDFWNCRVYTSPPSLRFSLTNTPAKQNVAGRTLVGLRYWNQVCRKNRYLTLINSGLITIIYKVDEDGESYWVFETRDVSFTIRLGRQTNLIVQNAAFETRQCSGFKVCEAFHTVFSD